MKIISIKLLLFLFLYVVVPAPALFAHDGHVHTHPESTILLESGLVCTHGETYLQDMLYISVKDLFSCLNYKIDWNAKTKAVNIIDNKWFKLQVTVESSLVKLGSRLLDIQYPVKILSNRAFVPITLIKAIYPNTLFNSEKNYILINRVWTVENIAELSNNVVMIKTYDESGNKLDSGSGVIVTEDGQVVTSDHTVNNASSIEVVLSDNSRIPATLTIRIEEYDLAILKIDEKIYSYGALGDSTSIQAGQDIVTISSPLGLLNTITIGIVSYPSRMMDGNNLIQISAPVYFGSSGGALFNMQGEVIGIISNGVDNAANINFAAPINVIKEYINIKQEN